MKKIILFAALAASMTLTGCKVSEEKVYKTIKEVRSMENYVIETEGTIGSSYVVDSSATKFLNVERLRYALMNNKVSTKLYVDKVNKREKLIVIFENNITKERKTILKALFKDDAIYVNIDEAKKFLNKEMENNVKDFNWLKVEYRDLKQSMFIRDYMSYISIIYGLNYDVVDVLKEKGIYDEIEIEEVKNIGDSINIKLEKDTLFNVITKLIVASYDKNIESNKALEEYFIELNDEFVGKTDEAKKKDIKRDVNLIFPVDKEVANDKRVIFEYNMMQNKANVFDFIKNFNLDFNLENKSKYIKGDFEFSFTENEYEFEAEGTFKLVENDLIVDEELYGKVTDFKRLTLGNKKILVINPAYNMYSEYNIDSKIDIKGNYISARDLFGALNMNMAWDGKTKQLYVINNKIKYMLTGKLIDNKFYIDINSLVGSEYLNVRNVNGQYVIEK
ncbi:MAG: hypothetical protein N4A47_06130 [Clostridia bacterium]|jgi:hypothetical protein|nr:hypothetical protein [Clostridia bacterium]